MLGRPCLRVAIVPLAHGPSGTPQPPVYLDLLAIHALQCWPVGDLVTVRTNPGQAAPACEFTVTAETARALCQAWVDGRACAAAG